MPSETTMPGSATGSAKTRLLGPPVGLTAEGSAVIRLARVICILAMTYVHVHPWAMEMDIAQHGVRVFDGVRLYVVEAFSRASVALLSVISGYLLLATGAGKGYGTLVRGKLRTLFVPLLAWNLIGLALMTAANGGRMPIGTDLRSILDGLVALAGWPVVTPLSFLRDILLCGLLSPVMVAVLRRAPLPALLAALCWYFLVPEGVVFLRPVIPLFFMVGLALAIHGLPRWPGTGFWWAVLAGWVLLPATIVVLRLRVEMGQDLGAIPGVGVEQVLHALRLAARVAGALSVLWLAQHLLHHPIGRVLARAEPYIFLFFCAHTLAFSLFWMLWEPAFGGYYGPAYPLFFATAPVLALLLTIPAARIAGRIAPGPLALLNGGRRLRKEEG
ncbi:MAG: hypothetical protein RLY86_867 [Pseudomonadota bacterium]|jgi:hypothetical protein